MRFRQPTHVYLNRFGLITHRLERSAATVFKEPNEEDRRSFAINLMTPSIEQSQSVLASTEVRKEGVSLGFLDQPFVALRTLMQYSEGCHD